MTKTKRLVYAGMFLCIALVLPFVTGQIKAVGKMLNLMHIPIFLCGLICGGLWGGIVGFIAPLLRSICFGMPTLYPNAIAMAFELATYGVIAGVLYKLLCKKKGAVFISLIIAMLIGRIIWGFSSVILWSFMGETFTFILFIKGAFIDSFIGIIVHLLIIPSIMCVVKLNHKKR